MTARAFPTHLNHPVPDRRTPPSLSESDDPGQTSPTRRTPPGPAGPKPTDHAHTPHTGPARTDLPIPPLPFQPDAPRPLLPTPTRRARPARPVLDRHTRPPHASPTLRARSYQPIPDKPRPHHNKPRHSRRSLPSRAWVIPTDQPMGTPPQSDRPDRAEPDPTDHIRAASTQHRLAMPTPLRVDYPPRGTPIPPIPRRLLFPSRPASFRQVKPGRT